MSFHLEERVERIKEYARLKEPFTVHDIAEFYNEPTHVYRRPIAYMLHRHDLFEVKPKPTAGERNRAQFYATRKDDTRKPQRIYFNGRYVPFILLTQIDIRTQEGYAIARYVEHCLSTLLTPERSHVYNLSKDEVLSSLRKELEAEVESAEKRLETMRGLLKDSRLKYMPRFASLVYSDRENARPKQVKEGLALLQEKITAYEIDNPELIISTALKHDRSVYPSPSVGAFKDDPQDDSDEAEKEE